MISDWQKIVQTQHGIIEFAEELARILAEAGIASQKALGDSPEFAVNKWSDVIRQRALELVRERKQPTKMQKKLTAVKTIEHK